MMADNSTKNIIERISIFYRKMDKFDCTGKAMMFAGNTIICDLANRHDAIFQEIYDHIRYSSLGKSLTPLPPSSLHMTIADMYTTRDFNGSIPEMCRWIMTNFAKKLTSLVKHVESKKVAPKISANVQFANYLTIPLKIEDSMEEIKDIRRRVVKSGCTPHRRFHPHLTLAYRYSDAYQDPEDLEKLQKLMEKIPPLTLEPAYVAYFEKITEFHRVK